MDYALLITLSITNILSFFAGALVYRKGIRGDSIVGETNPGQDLKETWDEI